MRIGVLVLVVGLAGCSDNRNAGAEAVRRQAEQEQAARRAAPAAPAVRIATPVPAGVHVPCAQLVDPAVFQTALAETQPLTVKDVTTSERDATASCSLVRGGKRPSEAAQRALEKRTGKLGVLPGDELCNVSAFCWTIESTERLRTRCKDRRQQDDESLGGYACVRVVAAGAFDVKVFQLFDADTRCILQIRGGPSNVDNELVERCARTARDSIGPDQIQVTRPGAGSAG